MKKYQMFAALFLSLLGISAFEKNDAGVLALTDDQKTALEKDGFLKETVDGFNAALGKNFTDETTASEATEATEVTLDVEAMKQLALELQAKNIALETANKDVATNADTIAKLNSEITNLKSDIRKLSDDSVPDKGAGTQHQQGDMKNQFNVLDEKQLGGMHGAHWSLERPYNARARAAILAKQGLQVAVPMASSTDYGQLQQDLGEFFRQGQDKAIASFIAEQKGVSDIFPTESGIIDREVITNLFMGEFSQADNSSSDFSKVVKGKYEILPEEVRMYDVMLAHEFKDLKKVEKTWIAGLLKSDGSSSIKMSFIQYLLTETAKVLNNEKNRRAVQGRRKEPIADVPGLAMEASDGVYAWIDGKIINNQVKTFKLGEVTPANIGEKIYEGTKTIPQELIDTGMIVLYLPTTMVTEYHKYNETHYALNQDYKADIMYVKEYPQVAIKAVPNPGAHRRLIWSLENNLKTLENIPGEMLNFRVIVKEWSVSVVSQWKEGFGAPLVGKKFERVQDMDYLHQFVFASDKDLSSSTFLPIEKDATTPSALFHSSLVSVANSELKTITDILDVEVGGVVTLKNGSDAFGIKILKAAKFSEISEAWTPALNDTITLMKRQDGKFIEIERATAGVDALLFAADATAPSVEGASEFMVNVNTTPTSITTLDNAVEGTIYTIYGNGSGANVSKIANSGNFALTGAIDLNTGTFIKLVLAADGKFHEVARG